jgi:hypothetical protein
MVGHRLISKSLLAGALGEHPELPLLCLCPGKIFLEEPKSSVRVWNVVVGVRGGIDIESRGKAPVPLQSKALVVAFEIRTRWRRIGAAGETLDFLFSQATGTSDSCLGRTGGRFIASCEGFS